MDLADRLRYLEELLLHPEVRRDPAQLSRLLAPGFQEFGSSGRIFDRDGIIAALALETPLNPPVLSLVDFVVLAETDTWALVCYRSLRHNTLGVLEASALRSSTWIFRESRWEMLFHQGTTEFTRSADDHA